jgi:hypothetical protein
MNILFITFLPSRHPPNFNQVSVSEIFADMEGRVSGGSICRPNPFAFFSYSIQGAMEHWHAGDVEQCNVYYEALALRCIHG